ncbi:octaprenyl diphosphate synthase [Thioalkalivibrio sp. XN8]|uniref:octaprenyl diphosphate synthase n=1 Tax=Thioalkalivibrio sp. XN8 TaxID=2712863 RepID=UPI0013EC1309|nr:octaprenyl diphosphate synthase [Thioalkalivibrio sp. XN8]NGP54256.1 octaprenyl diphosphate synthase [Thioalkalivibrio sp. XN8]
MPDPATAPADAAVAAPSIEDVRTPVAADLEALDRCIVASLRSDVALVDQVARYIVAGGGKRLRPLLVLLAARACGYQGEHHVEASAIVEFIHTATLLHDDVVDSSELRRGRDTANAVFGNEASVLVGDFLYSRAFQMMVRIGRMRVMEVMADATNTIAEGEVLQLMNCNDPDTDETRYFEVIRSKTAKLFEAGAQVAAILADADEATEAALADYGMRLGIAFQLVDDALDYGGTAAAMGKNIGDDLAEGKPTLPLIRAMELGSAAERELIRAVIEHGGLEELGAIHNAIESTGALHYTARLAREQADAAIEALETLPRSEFRDALAALARIAVDRTA